MCGKFVIKSGEKQEQHPLEAVINQKVQGINEGREAEAGRWEEDGSRGPAEQPE